MKNCRLPSARHINGNDLVGKLAACALACAVVLGVAAICLLVPRSPWSQDTKGQNPPNQQKKQEQGQFQIKAEVNLVTVPVTVRKPAGGFIKSLPKAAFHLTEDGEDQDILVFEQEGVPTRICIVLDISGSVKPEWGTIKYATK